MELFMEEINKLLPLIGSTLLINSSSQFEEYDLELTEQITAIAKEEKVELVTIPQFVFPILTEEVNRLDADANKLVNKFFEKTFLPHLLESNDWIQNLKESIDSIAQNFIKAGEIDDSYRRNKAFFKIKNEFYFKITSLFEKKQAYKFNELKHVTEKGLEWYLNEITKKVSSITNSYRIEHHKSSFKLNKTDSFTIKRFKLWKRVTHLFSKKTIPVFVHYRDLSEHYLKDRQILVLHQLLSEFEVWSYNFLHALKTQINAIDDFIDQSGVRFMNNELNKAEIDNTKTRLLKEILQIEKDIKNKQNNVMQELLA